MTMPNFLIIGTTKSGTTSLYAYLKQHPDILLSSIKESNFFAYEGKSVDYKWWGKPPSSTINSVTSKAAYEELFSTHNGQTAIGEVSPYYLYNKDAPSNIRKHIPNARLIVILRHPADRAYSNYLHLRRDSREPHSDFAAALNEEAKRIAENWGWDYFYQDFGFYADQLQRYFSVFPKEQIKIFFYEDLQKDPEGLLAKICCFLDIDSTVSFNLSSRENMSGIPKRHWVQKFVDQPNHFKPIIRLLFPLSLRNRIAYQIRKLNLQKPTLDPEIKKSLTNLYIKDIECLEKLAGQDLTHWKTT